MNRSGHVRNLGAVIVATFTSNQELRITGRGLIRRSGVIRPERLQVSWRHDVTPFRFHSVCRWKALCTQRSAPCASGQLGRAMPSCRRPAAVGCPRPSTPPTARPFAREALPSTRELEPTSRADGPWLSACPSSRSSGAGTTWDIGVSWFMWPDRIAEDGSEGKSDSRRFQLG